MLVALAMLGLGILTGCSSKLEKAVKPEVEEIVSNVFGSDAKCKKIKITEKVDGENYKAIAVMDDGKEYEILIHESEDSSVYVQLAIVARLEKEAIGLVDDIIRDNVGIRGAKCNWVTILKEIGKNRYKAQAMLSNLNYIDLTIEDRGDSIYVKLNL